MLFYALIISLLQLTPAGPKPTTKSLEALAKVALKRVEQMRKQPLSRPLKMGVKSKPEITRFIRKRMADEYGPAKIKAEGDLLRLQGLLPMGTNYAALISGLLTEQVAGFYDHTRKELHIADWLPSIVQGPVMAHEIFHAVQDQEWGAGKLIDSKRYSHDEVLAHAALLEGDATAVMVNYSQPPGSQDICLSAMAVQMLAASLPLQMSSPQYPVMAAAPNYMKQSLIFPYQQGFLFIAALRTAGMTWERMRDVYRDPPNSTEQILHPKKYYPTRDLPSQVILPEPFLPGFTVTWAGVAGEFHARQILMKSLPITEAATGAEGWDGDLTLVAADGKEKVAITLSTWDSTDDAEAFAAALKKSVSQGEPSGVTLRVHQKELNVAYAFSKNAKLAEMALDRALRDGKVKRR